MNAETEEDNLVYDCEHGSMAATCFHAMTYFIVYVTPVLIVVGVVVSLLTIYLWWCRLSVPSKSFTVSCPTGCCSRSKSDVHRSTVDGRTSSFTFYLVSSLGTSSHCPSSDWWPFVGRLPAAVPIISGRWRWQQQRRLSMWSYRQLPICTHSRWWTTTVKVNTKLFGSHPSP